MEVIEQLENELIPAQIRVENAEAELRGAGSAVQAAVDSKKRYANRAEIAEWQRKVGRAQKAYDEAEKGVRVVAPGPQNVLMRQQQARIRLQELEAKEFALRPIAEQRDLTRRGQDPLSRSRARRWRGESDRWRG